MISKEKLESEEQNELKNQSIKKFDDLVVDEYISEYVSKQDFNLSNIDSEFLNKHKILFLREYPQVREDFSKLEKSIDWKTNDEKLLALLEKNFEKSYTIKHDLLESVKTTYSKNFEFLENEKKVLDAKLSKLWLNELKKIATFKSFQEKFLIETKIVKNINEITKRPNWDDKVLSILWDFEKIQFNSDEDKIKFFRLFERYEYWSDIYLEDVEIALKYIDWDDKETKKRDLLNYFIEKISIKTLRDASLIWWKNSIISEDEINNKKDSIIDKYKAIYPSLKLERKDLDEDLIFIDSTEKINVDWIIENLLAEAIFQDLNQIKKDTINENFKNSILSKLIPEWYNDDINNSFIDYIKQSPIDWVSSIENLKWENYMVYETKKADWTIHRMFQKIESVDWWTSLYSKSINLRNLTNTYWISLDTTWISKDITYENFYEFLHTPEYAEEKWEEVKIKFLTKKELDDYLDWNKVSKIENAKETLSLEDLKNKIDAIDPAWANKDITVTKPQALTSFFVWNPGDKDYWYFSILDIQWGNITLSSKDYKTWKNEELSFNDFIAAFEQKDAKRWNFIWNRDSFIWEFLKMKSFDWKFEYKDWKLLEKVNSWEEARELEYLTNSEWNTIKIEEFGSSHVTICTWDLKEEKSKDWKSTKRTMSLSNPIRISYEDFYTYVNNVKSEKEDYNPFFKEEKEDNLNEVKDIKRWVSLGKALLSFYCISDITTGLAMIPKTIEESLKQGSSIRSAKFALAMWWVLPDSIRLQLQSNVEAQEKKEMEALIWKWWVLDSSDFIPLLRQIILNASSEEYEKEAALVFILKKYWVLYGKWFKDLKWTFIWYRAMWGEPGDETYVKYKKECEEWGIPFTEEYLIEALLKRQAKWELNPKRRSKFAKDYGWYINSWISEEKKDWEWKAGALLTTDARIAYALWEFKNQTYYNGIWALKKIWSKWWSSRQMNALPFIITSSWLTQSLTQDALDEYFSIAYSKPYSAIAFSKTQQDIDLYNRVSLKLAKTISNEAFEMLDSALKKDKEYEKVDALANFWKIHWDALTKKLSINQDPIIFLEKDKDPDYKDYYKKIQGVFLDDRYRVEKDALEDWVYNYDTGSFFLFWWDILGWPFFDKTWFSISSDDFSENNQWRMILMQYRNAYKDIAKLKMDDNWKKEVFKYYYKTMETFIHKKYKNNFDRAMKTTSVSAIHVKLKSSLWFEMYNFPDAAWNPNYASSSSYDKWLDEQWETYQNRYIKKNEVIKEKSNAQILKEEKADIENEVFEILSGKKKIIKNEEEVKNQTNSKKQKAGDKSIKEEKINELNDDELEEREDECNYYMDILKKSKNWSPEQINVVEKILNDELWSVPKKQWPGYISTHPFYKKKASWKLIDWKIDDNNCTIILPAWNWSIVIKDWKITYTNWPKK